MSRLTEAGRMDALEAATAVVERDFPGCLAAFLAGSVTRGDATPTSDLDIMVIVAPDEPTFRESFHAFGWPVEVFVHTLEAHRQFAAGDASRRRPSTSRMICEGLILRDGDGLAQDLKREACALLAAGPPPLTTEQAEAARYGLTDMLDDFAGATDPAETLFIANALAEAAADLLLDHHRHWRGQGKWLPRALGALGDGWVARFLGALTDFYDAGDKQPLSALVLDVLTEAGGPLWDGYRLSATSIEGTDD